VGGGGGGGCGGEKNGEGDISIRRGYFNNFRMIGFIKGFFVHLCQKLFVNALLSQSIGNTSANHVHITVITSRMTKTQVISNCSDYLKRLASSETKK